MSVDAANAPLGVDRLQSAEQTLQPDPAPPARPRPPVPSPAAPAVPVRGRPRPRPARPPLGNDPHVRRRSVVPCQSSHAFGAPMRLERPPARTIPAEPVAASLALRPRALLPEQPGPAWRRSPSTRRTCARRCKRPGAARTLLHLPRQPRQPRRPCPAEWPRIGRRRERRKPRVCRAFEVSGRQDLNLRPPGPQPGALPDCATPRCSSSEAGDGNRTRPKSLEGSCATTTLRPRADSPG